MPTGLTLVNTMKQGRAEYTRDRIDGAATPGKLAIYGNARPATGAAPGASPLAVIVLEQPCGTVSASGVLTITPPSESTQIINTGSPVWGRFFDGDDTPLMDCGAGTADAEVIVDQDTFYTGAFVALISAQFAEGG